ncbi:MAG: hypothetical protein U9O54_04925 [Chloroflexota bacterium]|nr:hypothetical protein [Chloroflexota bacterium]
MRVLKSVRERIGLVIGAGIGAVALLGCGLLFTLVLAPKQKLEAYQIERMPTMNADAVINAPAGESVLVTGWLTGEPLPNAGDFIAYELEKWVVDPADASTPDAEPDGDWETVRQLIPDLGLTIGEKTINLLSAEGAKLSGPMKEKLVYTDNYDTAEYNEEMLPDGSLRYSGFYDGNLVTVLGKKASTGGVIPDEYYAGDRVAFVDSKHSAAKGALIGGICMMGLAPLVLIGGVLAAVFKKR